MFHLGLCRFEALFERPVEISQDPDPVEMLLFDLVELLFHVTGKCNIHYFREIFAEFFCNNFTNIGGIEFFLFLLNVLSVLYRAND